MQGLNLKFRRLKETLTSIKTLGEVAFENSEFMINIKESL
jgi:hypothetical protein